MNNSDFLDHINKLSQRKLKQYRQQLQDQLDQELSELQQTANQLEEQLQQKQTYHKQVQKARTQFTQQLNQKFSQQRAWQQQVEKTWTKLTEKFFSQDKNVTLWLKSGLDQIPDQATGTLTAGKSASQIIKILNKTQTKNWKIKTDSQMDIGFIFENDQLMIDYRLSTYLQDQFNQHKHQLYQLLAT